MRIVITGTDTGVGKTWVGIALANALRKVRDVRAVKLVESGCAAAPSATEDGAQLARAAGQDSPRHALVRLRAPLTPALAAERDGIELDVRALCSEARSYEPPPAGGRDGVLLIEGAGGLLSPITYRHSLLDAAVILQARALVVGVDRLGVLNHALLTIAALQAEGIGVVGVVLTPPAVADDSTGTNALLLGRVTGTPVMVVPYVEDPRSEEAGRVVAPLLRWIDAADRDGCAARG